MISIIYSRNLAFCLAIFCQAILLLCVSTCQAADAVALARGLEINLPSALPLQIDQQNEKEFPTLIGETNDGQPYFIAATLIKIWERDPVLWKRLESSIRQQSKLSEPLLKAEDAITAPPHDIINYRIYEYQTEQQKQLHTYFLLKGEKSLYWISLTTEDNVDINTLIPIAQVLISRMRFVN